MNALDRQTVANRVVHISVQLFSTESLACKMVQEYNLLYILIVSLNNMVEQILTESTLQGKGKSKSGCVTVICFYLDKGLLFHCLEEEITTAITMVTS